MPEMNAATRLLGVVADTIEKKVKSGAFIEVTYGQIFGVSGAEASVYLAGSRELAASDGGTPEPSEGFRIPSHLYVGASDYVRVSMDARGHRWIDEVLGSSAMAKLVLDYANGKINFGDGLVSPDVNLYRISADKLATDDEFNIRRVAGTDFALALDVVGDTVLRFKMDANGEMQWGAGGVSARDITLGRVAAGVMSLSSALRFARGGDSNTAISTLVGADTQNKFIMQANGAMIWGSGTAGGDTNLYRSAASTLKTDDNFVANSLTTGAFNVMLPPGAEATGAALTLTTSLQTLPIDSTVGGSSTFVDTTNNRLSIPAGRAGLYLVSIVVRTTTALAGTSNLRVSTLVNGVEHTQLSGYETVPASTLASIARTATLVLADSDTISVQALGGAGLSGGAATLTINIVRLGNDYGA